MKFIWLDASLNLCIRWSQPINGSTTRKNQTKPESKLAKLELTFFQDNTHLLGKWFVHHTRLVYLVFVICFHFFWFYFGFHFSFSFVIFSFFWKVCVLWYSDGVPFMFVWITRDVAPGNWVPATVGPGHTWFLSCLSIFSSIWICIWNLHKIWNFS